MTYSFGMGCMYWGCPDAQNNKWTWNLAHSLCSGWGDRKITWNIFMERLARMGGQDNKHGNNSFIPSQPVFHLFLQPLFQHGITLLPLPRPLLLPRGWYPAPHIVPSSSSPDCLHAVNGGVSIFNHRPRHDLHSQLPRLLLLTCCSFPCAFGEKETELQNAWTGVFFFFSSRSSLMLPSANSSRFHSLVTVTAALSSRPHSSS